MKTYQFLFLALSFMPIRPALSQSPVHPLKVCIIQDKSGSSAQYGTPQLTQRTLQPITEAQVEVGGDTGVGFLDESSNWPLTRFYAPPIPPRPVEGKGITPSQKLAAKQAYMKAVREWKAELDARAIEAGREAERFYDSLKSELDRPASASQSDVIGSLLRCDRMLAEPDLQWGGREVLKYAVFVSDAEHAIRKMGPGDDRETTMPERLESGATIIVVNGKKHKGTLGEHFKVLAFENIESAVRHILSTVNPGGN